MAAVGEKHSKEMYIYQKGPDIFNTENGTGRMVTKLNRPSLSQCNHTFTAGNILDGSGLRHGLTTGGFLT